MSPHALVTSPDDLVSPTTSTDPTTERATAVMTTLTAPTPLTSIDSEVDRLDRLTDEIAVDTLLTSILTRRRALRRARRQLAAEQARQEYERFLERTLLGAGVSHLR